MISRMLILVVVLLLRPPVMPALAHELEQEFAHPPDSARPWVYWWWLNGNASQQGITRDFEEMKRHGIGGALLFDAGEARTNDVPPGPPFMSRAWRELFRHAVREADRLGIVLTVNLCSGWNAGGPWVTPELAAKKLVSAQSFLNGPGRTNVLLPIPPAVGGFYRDLVVWAQPSALSSSGTPSIWSRAQAVDVTSCVDAKGQLTWDVPAGRWKILRIGYTLTGRAISNPGSGPAGPEIDPMNADAMEAHFAQTGAKLIADAGPLAGKTLQYFHIDSWEIGQPTWTSQMPDEFRQRRGYNLLPWLPAVLGETVDSEAETQRLMRDFRRTVADLVAANYYGRLQKLSVKGGLLGAHAEAGGPIGVHHFWADALQNLGANAIPMGEFWARNNQPEGAIFYGPHNHTIKEIACAAHTYGKPLCQAEAFTSLADDFSEDPWSLKDLGDAAFCDGLTRMVFHNWPTHLDPEAQPGNWWIHIGTHFGYNVTWWPMADGWLTYLARCQHLLRQGRFVADFAYLQNEAIPSFVARRSDQRPPRPAGFDYDVLSAEVILSRASARHLRLTLPDGMSYRYLVLPHQPDAVLSPATLRKINELARAGVPVIGPTNLTAVVKPLRLGPLEAVTRADGIAPDLELRDLSRGADLDWIHRRDGGTEIYFLSNQRASEANARVVFRVAGKPPELWDAVTGNLGELPEWREEGPRTVVPMKFAPRQTWFVVFRDKHRSKHPSAPKAAKNFPELKRVQDLAGPWTVQFDPKWFYPVTGLHGDAVTGMVRFEQLEDWSLKPESAIQHFSGIAVYRQAFDLGAVPSGRVLLDLGVVKNVARVRLNGRDLGVVWTAPWQVEITGVVKAKANELEIEIANLWPNRLIGDSGLPRAQRRTVSNIATYETVLSQDWLSGSNWGRSTCPSCIERLKTGKPAALLPSGLLGPVTIQTTETDPAR